MSIDNHGHEYEFEPQFGLPERLPSNERILWQGSPDVGTLAKSAFHFRKLVVYFCILLLAGVYPALEAGAGPLEVLLALKWLGPLSASGLITAWFLAWLTASTTVYTLTNQRIVMRLGIVLTVTFNFPLSKIASADLRTLSGGHGDITLNLKGEDRIAWVHLWPSVRPWRISKPEPTLRAVAHVKGLATELSAAWSAVNGPSAAMANNAPSRALGTPGRLQASAT
jgi:hypothetical protein